MGLLSQPNVHVIKVTGRQEGIREIEEEVTGWRLNLIGSLKPQHMEELAESQAKYTRRKLSKTNPKFPKTTDKEKNVKNNRPETSCLPRGKKTRAGEFSHGRSGVRGPVSSRQMSVLEFYMHRVFSKKQNKTKCLSSLQKSNKFVIHAHY